MKRGLFCPSCGTTKGPFFRGLCKECFLHQKKLIDVPEEIKIEHCKSCNRIRIQGRWIGQTEQALKDFLKKKAKARELHNAALEIALEPLGENTLAIIKATGIVDGNKITAEGKTMLVPMEMRCDSCMKLRSDYFEAIIQIRLSDKAKVKGQALLSKINKLLEGMQKTDKLASIVRIIDKDNGFDVVFASKKAAQKIVKSLSADASEPVKTSFKLAGMTKDGNEKKRFTYCLRF